MRLAPKMRSEIAMASYYADDIEELETDYRLSMEVLDEVIDLTFPDAVVHDPYMRTLRSKARDAIKRWKERVKDESYQEQQ